MQALNATMEAALCDGRTPSAAELGGLAAILASADGVASSRFAPEYMALVLDQADLNDPGVQTFSCVQRHPELTPLRHEELTPTLFGLSD